MLLFSFLNLFKQNQTGLWQNSDRVGGKTQTGRAPVFLLFTLPLAYCKGPGALGLCSCDKKAGSLAETHIYIYIYI